MTFEPVTENNKQVWIDFLKERISGLKKVPDNPNKNEILKTDEGDVAAIKDVMGCFLATLTNENVEI